MKRWGFGGRSVETPRGDKARLSAVLSLVAGFREAEIGVELVIEVCAVHWVSGACALARRVSPAYFADTAFPSRHASKMLSPNPTRMTGPLAVTSA